MSGHTKTLPNQRQHTIHFNASKKVELTDIEGAEIIFETYSKESKRTTVTIRFVSEKEVVLSFERFDIIEQQDINDELFKRLNTAQGGYFLKDDLYNDFDK